jgi:hypothetical protein
MRVAYVDLGLGLETFREIGVDLHENLAMHAVRSLQTTDDQICRLAIFKRA